MWTGTWGDEHIESWAARKLWVEDGCRVITQHSDTDEPQKVFRDNGPHACEAGIIDERECLNADETAAVAAIPGDGAGIGYNADMRQIVGDSVLTSVRVTWGPPVDYFVKELLNGNWPTQSNGNSLNYYPGVADMPTVNTLADFSSRVSYTASLDVSTRLAAMRSGEAPTIFCGQLKKQDGSAVTRSKSSQV